MSDFDETKHPRGHASNPGAFSGKDNSVPESSLGGAWSPKYEQWRHGGWYVTNIQYITGAVGCVSRNYADRKWRIVCDKRPFDTAPTFRSRDEAAAAERAYTKSPEVLEDNLAALRRWKAADVARGKTSGPAIDRIEQQIAYGERLLGAEPR